ncbi:MAG: hypothetical protein ACLRHY_07090 [[Eubacterium] siraeum]
MSEQNVKQSKSDSEVQNNKKCFIIMPISTPEGYTENHFKQVYETIIAPAVVKAGYEPYRVDDDRICDSIIDKILRNLVECEMAVCDLSSRNPNVMYELGIRQAYGKKVVLIQDEKSQPIFDVSAINTVFYNSRRIYEDVIASQNNISEAIISTAKEDSISLMSIANMRPATIEAQSENDDKQISEKLLLSILSTVRRLEQSQVMQSRKLNVPITSNDYILARYFDLQNDIDKAISRQKVDKDELDYYRRKISFFISELLHDSNMLSDEQKDILASAINIRNKLQTMIDEI